MRSLICTRPFRQATEHWFPAAKSLTVHPGIVVVYAELQVAGKLVDFGAKSESANALAAAALARTKMVDEKSIRGILMMLKDQEAQGIDGDTQRQFAMGGAKAFFVWHLRQLMKQASRPGPRLSADAVDLHCRWEVSNGEKMSMGNDGHTGRSGIIAAGSHEIWLDGAVTGR
jgi:hypothetical protein